MQAWLIEAYETDKIEVETAYESLMRQEEAQHRERMDNYAAMRTASLERLVEKYGLIQPPAA
jgi:hypothetical protein